MPDERLTAEQLAEIEARWAKATPGPWGHCVSHPLHEAPTVTADGMRPGSVFVCSCSTDDELQGLSDAEAIAAAPTDIARLLSALRAGERERDPFPVVEAALLAEAREYEALAEQEIAGRNDPQEVARLRRIAREQWAGHDAVIRLRLRSPARALSPGAAMGETR